MFNDDYEDILQLKGEKHPYFDMSGIHSFNLLPVKQ